MRGDSDMSNSQYMQVSRMMREKHRKEMDDIYKICDELKEINKPKISFFGKIKKWIRGEKS